MRITTTTTKSGIRMRFVIIIGLIINGCTEGTMSSSEETPMLAPVLKTVDADKIQPDLKFPILIQEFARLAHGLRSGNITIVDERTFSIPNLHYDGTGPDTFFLVGNGSEPHGAGTKLLDEQGRSEKLLEYTGKDIVIRLPDNLTVKQIDWLAVYCITYRHNFGHVFMPWSNFAGASNKSPEASRASAVPSVFHISMIMLLCGMYRIRFMQVV